MSSGYALKCIGGPLKGMWYMRGSTVLRFTKVKAAALAGKLNSLPTWQMWFATKYRKTDTQ